MKTKNRLIALIIFVCITCNANVCNAEITVPSNINPGALNKDIKQDSFKIPPLPHTKEDIELPKPHANNINTNQQKSLKFILNKINFSGNNIIKTVELEKISKELIGKEIFLEDLINTANKITELYANNGYFTSSAYIPVQTIENGTAEIKIIEGEIGDIKIKGAKWIKPKYIKNNLLKSNKISENKILNVNNLTQSMSEINNMNYLKGKVIVKEGEAPGKTDLIIDIKDRFPLSLSANWNNTGRESIGIKRTGIKTSIDNITGYGDKVWANNTIAKRTYGINTGYSFPVGENGSNLSISYSFLNSHPGGIYKPMQMEGVSHSISTSFNHPLYKSKALEVNSSIAFDILNSDNTIYKNTSLNKYDVRVLRTGISLKNEDKNGKWLGDFTVNTGLPIMGATDNGNKLVPDSKFVTFIPSVIRIQKLPKNCITIFKANAQFATSTLLSSEQMSLGGFSTVRGFNEAFLFGDAGFNFSIEARTPLIFLPENINIPYKKDKSFKLPIKKNIQFAAFYDNGWTKEVGTGQTSNYKNFLQSIGTGLRINFDNYFSANLDIGIPLGKERYENQKPIRFHFYLNADVI